MKEEPYTSRISAHITQRQRDKINRSGLSDSKYIREAIDFYDVARLEAYSRMKMDIINDCIGALNIFKQNVEQSDENLFNKLKENVQSVEQNRGKMSEETPQSAHKKDENVEQIYVVEQTMSEEIDENVEREEFEKSVKTGKV